MTGAQPRLVDYLNKSINKTRVVLEMLRLFQHQRTPEKFYMAGIIISGRLIMCKYTYFYTPNPSK